MDEVVLSNSQEEACDAFRLFLVDPEKKEFLLSGFAGSGKSFLVKHLVEVTAEEHELMKHIVANKVRPRFIFTATTNKAASVLEEISGTKIGEGHTIHSMLGLTLQSDRRTGKRYLKKTKDFKRPLSNSILVIDEASMANAELLDIIRSETRNIPNCKILWVGDSYQLPPVKEEPCSIFHSTDIDTMFLTDIQRQAADSPIISYAHHFREVLDDPELPWPEIPHDGDNIIYYKDGKDFEKAMVQTYQDYHADGNVHALKTLAWTNKHVRDLNSMIRSRLGYSDDFTKGESVTSNGAIVKGGRTCATTDSLWTIEGMEYHQEEGVEGHLMTLVSLDPRMAGSFFKAFQPTDWGHAGRVISEYRKRKNWGKVFQLQDEWADLRPLYAQTVHKSQGSTYLETFININDIAKNNKWAEVARLMYVAITRAKLRVHLFGQLEERYTRLSNKSRMEIFKNAEQEQNGESVSTATA